MNWQWFIEYFITQGIPLLLLKSRSMIIEFLPYLVMGILVGELLKFAAWAKIIYKWVTKAPVVSVIVGSVIGIVSPLCTYGTIPVVIQLYKSKVHIAPLVSFMAASALMNPQLFLMTAGGIGIEMAVVLTVAVFIFSFAAGLLCYVIPAKIMVRKSINVNEDGGDAILNREKKLFIVKQYAINCLKSFKSVGVFVLIGVLISAAAEVYIPNRITAYAMQAGRIPTILAGALMGIPMYACGGGAIPFVRNFILGNGLGKGTALAFFLVGSATRPAPLIGMAALFTPLFLAGYCVFLIISSVLMGIVYI
jgi:uncharacterized membrane protein YraQ (UPF0718 family)